VRILQIGRLSRNYGRRLQSVKEIGISSS
jgi:hypothetical protein